MNHSVWKNEILKFLHENFKFHHRKNRSKENVLIVSEIGKASLFIECLPTGDLVIKFIKFDEKFRGKGIFSALIKLCAKLVLNNNGKNIIIEHVVSKNMADIAEWLDFKHIKNAEDLIGSGYGDYILKAREIHYAKI